MSTEDAGGRDGRGGRGDGGGHGSASGDGASGGGRGDGARAAGDGRGRDGDEAVGEGGRRRVLVVDDDRAVRALLCDAAQEVGYATAEAATRAELDAALALFAPTLVLLDLTIPGTDAGELLRDLADRRRPPAVILVSGQDVARLALMEADARTLGLAIRGVLAKPIRVRDLWTLLEADAAALP